MSVAEAFSTVLGWVVQLWNACFNNYILAIPIYLVLINGLMVAVDKIKKLIK